ncbi:formylmethanofuran dehydrogenase subunit B [Candidatus Methanocrinis natronophilus]|uniref:Formylmethanofuran dehydrogenase subunit B n=1 Tax=Candidatus Methanocrinis natronophilus TaxID=3033396 RepID=A0ABT5X9H3_9EURY|nr:formylmethanofuran dehydrogenase subunit B [Candidatus Methanocrinis natronophilus]MDF0591332.1 formylmethanofuran dehydrogenase subunit B [Candidatus Methanocrinis natronophilus]
MAFCTGCSLLCDDIVVDLDGGKIGKTMNLCRKGHAHYSSISSGRLTPSVDGSEVGVEDAMMAAAEVLAGADNPLLFGWGGSTLEAQRAGVDLAKKLGGAIDDPSSYSQGLITEKIIAGDLPTCTLDDVRNFADVSIYWGDDPSSSHPRHMSRFSYFPRGEKRQRGYEEDREAIVIDVRKSPTAQIAADGFFKITPGGDGAFIEALVASLAGKIPKVEDKKRMLNLGTKLRKAKFGAIFTGQGLAHSLRGDLSGFVSLVGKLSEITRFSVIPTLGDYNTRGFNQTLFDETGHVNSVTFKDGVRHGQEFSIARLLDSCDAVMVVGSDPAAALPAAIAKKLAKAVTVAIGSHRNMTTDFAKVSVPMAVAGIEAGGSCLRTDGVRVEFDGLVGSDHLSDVDIIKRIMEAV